ncbi:MAG: acyl-CoA dehydrogenase family protein [Gammaproteobacteria bacterium]|nr:acyl-CoA dehydrogenase family protein [Gammaproteobacteria bacterium]
MADIELTDEQAMLLETAADFCRNNSPVDQVRARIEHEDSIEPEVWQKMVELGWLGINVPEEQGGLGLGMASVVPIAEAMGRYLMSSPFNATVLASEAILAGGGAEQQSRWLPRIVAGSVATAALTEPDGSWRLDEMAAVGTQQDDEVALSG